MRFSREIYFFIDFLEIIIILLVIVDSVGSLLSYRCPSCGRSGLTAQAPQPTPVSGSIDKGVGGVITTHTCVLHPIMLFTCMCVC